MKHNPIGLARYPVSIRLTVFVAALLILWMPIAAPIYWLFSDQNLINILTLPLLYGEFVLLLQLWSKYVYSQQNFLRYYGLERTRRNGRELLIGLGIGITIVFSLFLAEGWLGWLRWQRPTIFFPQLILEGLVIALAYGWAEELLFRGWLLDELQRDYSPRVTLWADALLFTLLHFIKPLSEILRTLAQLPALLLLGLVLVLARRYRQGRLGLPIGFHAGLLWGYYIINVGKLVQYSGQVPNWITGIDNNPLAGMVGLLVMSLIVFWMGRLSNSKNSAI